MRPSAGPLEIILSDIEKALQAELWYVALAVTLSLPDICSLLELPEEERSKRRKYAAWFDRNMGRHYRFLTGDDCYSLRGGVVHHGKFGHVQARYDRIGFTFPGRNRPRIGELLSEDNGGIKESMLVLDVEMFCSTMLAAVREWFTANANNPVVLANLPNVVRTQLHGVPPHIVGVPVIASDRIGPPKPLPGFERSSGLTD